MASSPQDRFTVTLDAPVTLLFIVAAAAATVVPGVSSLLRLDPVGFAVFYQPRWYLGVVGHAFAHQDLAHFLGNASMLLLLAPSLERRLGSGTFAIVLGLLIGLTGLSASGVLFFTQKSLVGASGVVFALIFLHALVDGKGQEVPLTALLLAVIWGAKEVLGLFDGSHIANSAHLNGAVWGFIFGLGLRKDPAPPPGPAVSPGP